MIQSQWPGLGRTQTNPLDPAGPRARRIDAGPAAQAASRPDGVASPWWTCGTGTIGGNGALGGGDGDTLTALIASLIGRLQKLIGGFIGESTAEGGAQQQFTSLDVSSTGDPHLAATGTLSGSNTPLEQRFDSMTSHDDLVHSSAIDGGYRVSTVVTQPGANGVTSNQSATVHAGYGWDEITVNRDGSYAISDDGEPVQLAKGRSLELSGGETVTRNDDGSLTVRAANEEGGTIATTMRATGPGVDVTTHAEHLAVGGDVVDHGAQAGPGTPHAHGHGHRHHRRPLAAPVPAAATAPPG